MTGPTAMPAWTPIVTMLFAHDRSSSDSTRFGIAARDAEKNGSSAIADPNAKAISSPGSFAKIIAAKKTAEIASDQIITVLRLYRSPSAPVSGPTRPATPNVSRSDSACMKGEWVRSHTV